MSVPSSFPLVPLLRWDKPSEARLLRYIEETRGEEMARITTLPDEEYLREIGDLVALNWRDEDGVAEYGA